MTSHHKQTGVSLIEVMISIVIFSIGLMGMGALQITALQTTSDSYLRTLASFQAYDMAERMRANTAGVSANLYNNISGTGTAVNCTPDCTPSEIATNDTFQWNTKNASILPSGQGTVQGSGTGNLFTITIHWDDERMGATGLGCDTNNPADLKCLTITLVL